jgi:hypothetical protein
VKFLVVGRHTLPRTSDRRGATAPAEFGEERSWGECLRNPHVPGAAANNICAPPRWNALTGGHGGGIADDSSRRLFSRVASLVQRMRQLTASAMR